MRVALLSDVHANWQALQAVLDDFENIDDVICLGDVVGYGGDPARCLDRVRSEGWLTLVGNHDRACTDPDLLAWFNPEAAAVITWTIDRLDASQLRWLRDLPERGGRDGVQLVHASPRDPIYEYVLDGATAIANLVLLGDSVCFHGHSHVPGVFRMDSDKVAHDYWLGDLDLEGPALVNPGSVGQPRDGVPDASYAIWDVEAQTFSWRRVPYDRSGAQAAIRSAGLPERFAIRLDLGL